MIINEFKILRDDITYKLDAFKGRYFVYLLLENEMVIYVGRTINLRCRLYSHKYSKKFNYVYLCEFVKGNDYKNAEKIITKHFMPNENKLWVKYG